MMLRYLLVAAAIISLTACGGGGKKNAAAPGASPATGTYSRSSNGTANNASGAVEPVPAGMNCGGTQPVWVNERSRVFHLAGDPYYGRTKHGKYMCERDAAKAGYHPSRS